MDELEDGFWMRWTGPGTDSRGGVWVHRWGQEGADTLDDRFGREQTSLYRKMVFLFPCVPRESVSLSIEPNQTSHTRTLVCGGGCGVPLEPAVTIQENSTCHGGRCQDMCLIYSTLT